MGAPAIALSPVPVIVPAPGMVGARSSGWIQVVEWRKVPEYQGHFSGFGDKDGNMQGKGHTGHAGHIIQGKGNFSGGGDTRGKGGRGVTVLYSSTPL